MKNKELRNALLEYNGNRAFISTRKVRDWLGIGQNSAVDLLKGLPAVEGKFFIPDVARRITERSVVKWQE